ncbi:MAG: hypothetical protein IPL26_21975 [Leptospiraceae bacterium]|nr:hypothetical protein [Leptospiraceae bacterium]
MECQAPNEIFLPFLEKKLYSITQISNLAKARLEIWVMMTSLPAGYRAIAQTHFMLNSKIIFKSYSDDSFQFLLEI